MESLQLLVFKAHCGAIEFVVQEKGTDIAREPGIKEVAAAIRSVMKNRKGNPSVNLNCSPDFEIIISYGKYPIRNEPLSKKEKRELLDELKKI